MAASLYANPIPLPTSTQAGGQSTGMSPQPAGNSLYAQGAPNFGLSNQDWVNHAYQTYLNRQPDPAGGQYWQGQLNGGSASPASMIWSMRDSPEGQIASLYDWYLGRSPDAEGLAHYSGVLNNLGADAVREGIMNSEEARNYALGDGYLKQARAATQGINNMPYVFSDTQALTGGSSLQPKTPFEALFASGQSAGQNTINNMQGLLESIFAAPAETDDTDKDKQIDLTKRTQRDGTVVYGDDQNADGRQRTVGPNWR